MARRARPQNEVRIIGGTHRGRKLRFPSQSGLRPTPDRVRETLFNWLQPLITGARCLDVFAGSGALGLEAASRGAARVTLIDQSAQAVRQLEENLALLGLQGVEVVRCDALGWLERPGEPYDIVFLDPPYTSGLQGPCARLLEQRDWLAPGARIYLEALVRGEPPELPANWSPLKRKIAGEVSYSLLQRG